MVRRTAHGSTHPVDFSENGEYSFKVFSRERVSKDFEDLQGKYRETRRLASFKDRDTSYNFSSGPPSTEINWTS